MKKNLEILNEELNIENNAVIEQTAETMEEIYNEKEVKKPSRTPRKKTTEVTETVKTPLKTVKPRTHKTVKPVLDEQSTEEPLPVVEDELQAETKTDEHLNVEIELQVEIAAVEPSYIELEPEEILPIEMEEEVVEKHQDVLLMEDRMEETIEMSDEVVTEFDKELLSAQNQSEQTEEPEQPKKEKEIIPDYHSYEPEALIEALNDLLQEELFESIKGRVSAIKLAFMEHERAAIQEAKKEAEEETEEYVFPYSERFNAVFDQYKQKKAKFMEDLEKEKEENLEKKNNILEELRALLISEQPLKITYDRFRELQEQWKNIGLVPKQEIASLWNNYHFLIEKFFDKVRIHRELKELDLKKNLELKITLCEKAEELLLEDNAIDAFKKLQSYHIQWREIGAVPNTQREDIWERFKFVSDTINQRHRDYFDNMRTEHESNAHAKTAICEKTEEIIAQTYTSVTDWNKKTDEMDELFKLWKSIGPVGKKQSIELWARFSKAMNTFHRNKQEFFRKIKETIMDNYNKKLNICVEAEALKDNTDWKITSKEFVRMQEEWKSIGPVPAKLSDKIWKRFRAACDHFFTAKESFFSNVSAAEPENLKAKKAIIEELKNCEFTGMRTENLDILKNFQNRWLAIGFVPFKEKERLQTEYRQILNEKMKQLNITFYEMNEGRPFRGEDNQNQQGRRTGGNETALRKEIIYLQNKVSTMQDEINLWENNIGFLSSSKNADILKQEFEKKIQKAKNDLELNVAKLKYLRQELDKQ